MQEVLSKAEGKIPLHEQESYELSLFDEANQLGLGIAFVRSMRNGQRLIGKSC